MGETRKSFVVVEELLPFPDSPLLVREEPRALLGNQHLLSTCYMPAA